MPFPNELMIGHLSDYDFVEDMVAISSLGQGVYASKIAEGAFTVDPVHHSVITRLSDGTQQENGWLQCSWHIAGLRAEQYAALEVYKEELSTEVYIRTLDNDGVIYKNYSAVMIWPVKPVRGSPTAVENGIVSDFELVFIRLVEIPEE